MQNEKGKNKKKREQKKKERLKRIVGIDFCACGAGNQLKCKGVCRDNHTNPETNRVECGALYQIDRSEIKSEGKKRPKKDWKFGRQKNVNENKQTKQNRREKMSRDKSD